MGDGAALAASPSAARQRLALPSQHSTLIPFWGFHLLSVGPFGGKHWGTPYTIGRNRPTTSWRQLAIWPSEHTSAASIMAGKQFSSVSTTAASFSRALSAFPAFFALNFLSRSTCNCCLDRGVRASSNSVISSESFRYLFNAIIGRVPS